MSLVPSSTTFQILSKTIGIIRESLSYNAHGELARQTVTNTQTSAVLYDVVYDDGAAFARDALGRIARRTETVLGETHTFDYGYNIDGRPWLETVERDGALVSNYAYDGNGNRTAVMLDRTYAGSGITDLSGSEIVTDPEDRLTTYGGMTLEYNGLGRVIRKTEGTAITTYTWDSLGALKSVDLPDGRVIEYLTDGVGRRVGKMIDGVLQRKWIYRDTLRPIAELDAAGNVVWVCGRAVRSGYGVGEVRGARVRSGDWAVVGEGSDTVRQRASKSLWLRRQRLA
jgi:YD repeat-containing protein